MDEPFLTFFGLFDLMVDRRIELVVFITLLLGADVKGKTFNLPKA